VTRTEIQKEVLRLNQELVAARRRIREAQERARATGLKLPAQEYAALWRDIYELEGSIESARLELSTAEDTAAERFVAMVRAQHPEVYTLVARWVDMDR
jgi:predicted  nucleic acid-binding Zn-ribbon protein